MSLTPKLTRLASLLVILYFGATAQHLSAKTRCSPTPQGSLCISEVDFTKFAQTAFKNQEKPQWCWAASVSMLFSYYGHPVNQKRIVETLYGAPVNLGSGPAWNVAALVNRTWTDDKDQSFVSQLTSAYDADAGVNAVNNAWLINELDEDRPFIIGTTHHAVVATAIQYFPTPTGPNVMAIGVFDPWPGIGARGLTRLEMTPMHLGGGLRFVATVKVSDGE